MPRKKSYSGFALHRTSNCQFSARNDTPSLKTHTSSKIKSSGAFSVLKSKSIAFDVQLFSYCCMDTEEPILWLKSIGGCGLTLTKFESCCTGCKDDGLVLVRVLKFSSLMVSCNKATLYLVVCNPLPDEVLYYQMLQRAWFLRGMLRFIRGSSSYSDHTSCVVSTTSAMHWRLVFYFN